jgi:hypothetical protein
MIDRNGPVVSRRNLLAGVLAGGAAAATLPLAGAASARAAEAPAAGTPTPATPTAFTYFADPSLNFQALFAVSAAAYGASELGEVMTTFDRVHARGDTYAAYCEVFERAGRRLRERGDAARARGQRVSARGAYLRSAMYFDQALYFVLATSRPTRAHEGAVYRQMERSWALAASQATGGQRFERVRIPYGKTTLPGWLVTADGAGPRSRRPTIILNNGSDAQNIDMWVYGGAAALERGWNALIFEGPGQGANLFLRNMPFRPDWERVITPVVDFLRTRPEVDRRRITLAGQSFGGYLVQRAAAFEHRLAGVVADPGVVDPFVSWSGSLPRDMLELLDAGRREEFDGSWAEALKQFPSTERFTVAKRSEIYGGGDFYSRMRLASRFRLTRAISRRIVAPTALLSPEDEQFFPGQPRTAYDWLTTTPKTLLRFTAAEGAQFHCEPMAPQLRNERVYDWLERNLQPTS